MAVWLVRAEKLGELELNFIKRDKSMWRGNVSMLFCLRLSTNRDWKKSGRPIPRKKSKIIMNWASQLWPFAGEMSEGDLIITPIKAQQAICIGHISGSYVCESNGLRPFFIGALCIGYPKLSLVLILGKFF